MGMLAINKNMHVVIITYPDGRVEEWPYFSLYNAIAFAQNIVEDDHYNKIIEDERRVVQLKKADGTYKKIMRKKL